MQARGRGRIADVEVRRIAQAFGLGGVREVRFLPARMMNRNWRLRTDAGVFALKEIVDVPVPEARRSLVTVRALAAAGLPVCEPRPAVGGDVVAEVDDAGFFCLLPWVDGDHRRGTDLDVGQARELGLLLGRIHRALADAGLGRWMCGRGPRWARRRRRRPRPIGSSGSSAPCRARSRSMPLPPRRWSGARSCWPFTRAIVLVMRWRAARSGGRTATFSR
ncbi:hypothetical protein BKM31_17190 [[Actinomadura] parvosata subsp. kistnae]|uniref:Aminoglycoside phosphotransferase domain-containing protein n=1 Tax=[Actinomadura] parvosata subsp. kistnae TaxID=1909395 RepID=A0A1U9ZYE1_9ACTN|nr:hypothetical protein BKM31_17190 [Nonomuraea sp. ATCC 55076]